MVIHEISTSQKELTKIEKRHFFYIRLGKGFWRNLYTVTYARILNINISKFNSTKFKSSAYSCRAIPELSSTLTFF